MVRLHQVVSATQLAESVTRKKGFIDDSGQSAESPFYSGNREDAGKGWG